MDSSALERTGMQCLRVGVVHVILFIISIVITVAMFVMMTKKTFETQTIVLWFIHVVVTDQ